MKKITLVIFCTLFIFNYAQISLDIKYLGKVENNLFTKRKIRIVITNTSSETIVLPIDTTQVRGYFQEEECVNFTNTDFRRNLRFEALMEADGRLEDTYAGMKKLDDLSDVDGLMNIIKKRERVKKEKLRKWQIKYGINEEEGWIEKNEYLFNNLLIIKPLQNKTYIFYFEDYKMDCDRDCNT